MTKARIVICCIFFFIVQYSFGQYSNFRCRWIKPSEAGVKLDTFSVIPGSIETKYPSGYTATYNVNTSLITFSPLPLPDSILVCYRVFPFDLSKRTYKRNLSMYDSVTGYREVIRMPGFINNQQQREELFTTPGINKTGVISRGISVGNNQSVFVNSTLNLQLDGKLSDHLMLTAVISDQNIPFQPEGNTQQIQQFDKVYIQLKGPRTTLTVGDIVLNQKSYFLNYYRNIQGGTVQYTYTKDSTLQSVSQAGIGISKGKFNTIQFAPGTANALSEGVQGPYRLTGPNNETFITILANSEKIYQDGNLLTRGFDYDYTINYNTAEITFTPKVLITQYTRVRVDFEYTDQNYSRTNTAVSQNFLTKKGTFGFSYYGEKDNPRNPLTLSLNQSDQNYLSSIGNNTALAFLPGVDSVGYSQSATLYKKIYIGTTPVYQFSANPDSAFYQVTFSQVPAGTGSYVVANSTINAQVFTYVGANQGNYEPVQFVPLPQQKQMAQFSMTQNISRHEQIFSDVAFSNYNQNLYSTLDKSTDNGISARGGIKSTGRDIGLIKKYYLSSAATYEFNSKNFTAIDRFRGPDFERNWNENINIIGNNNMLTGNITYAKNKNDLFSYTVNYRNKQNDLQGLIHQVQLYHNFGNLFFKGDGFYSKTKNNLGEAGWQKYNVQLYYKTKLFTPGFQYNTEKNRVDSSGYTIQSLMYYEEYKGYIQSNDTTKVHFRLDQSFRNDWQVFGIQLSPSTKAQTTNFTSGIRFSSTNQLNILTTYRYLDNISSTATPNDETIMSRISWNAAAFKRLVRSELTITTGTGRQAKLQFVFQPVATGTGNYIWIDSNHDGIQEINEFVPKVYNDSAEYVKVYLPTNQYYKAYTNVINYRLDLSTPHAWKSSKVIFLKVLSRLSNTSSFTLNNKTSDVDLIKRFNPFASINSDTNLLAFQRIIKSAFFYNRSNSIFGMDLTVTSNQSRQFLTQGFENQLLNDLTQSTRMTFKRLYAVKITLSTGITSLTSDFSPANNYYIPYKKIDNQFSFQPRSNLRLSLLSGGAYKVNTISTGNGEYSVMYNIGYEVKLNKLSKRTFTTTLKYIHIHSVLNGTAESTPVAYQLLDALMPGNNVTWNVTWQERLTNGLQLSFTYDGRKSEGGKAIHTGRMQLSALF